MWSCLKLGHGLIRHSSLVRDCEFAVNFFEKSIDKGNDNWIISWHWGFNDSQAQTNSFTLINGQTKNVGKIQFF